MLRVLRVVGYNLLSPCRGAYVPVCTQLFCAVVCCCVPFPCILNLIFLFFSGFFFLNWAFNDAAKAVWLESFVDNHGGPRTRSLEAVLWLPLEEVGRMLEMGSGQQQLENQWGDDGDSGQVWAAVNLVLFWGSLEGSKLAVVFLWVGGEGELAQLLNALLFTFLPPFRW